MLASLIGLARTVAGGWQIYAAVLAVGIAVGGYGAWRVATWRCDSQEKASIEAALAMYKAETKRAAEASISLETKRDEIRERTRTIVKTVDRIVERPVYRNVCFDDLGLRAANDAITGTAGAPGKSDGAVPPSGSPR